MREAREDQAAGRVPSTPGSLLIFRLTRVVMEAIPGGREPTIPEHGRGREPLEKEFETGQEVRQRMWLLKLKHDMKCSTYSS